MENSKWRKRAANPKDIRHNAVAPLNCDAHSLQPEIFKHLHRRKRRDATMTRAVCIDNALLSSKATVCVHSIKFVVGKTPLLNLHKVRINIT